MLLHDIYITTKIPRLLYSLRDDWAYAVLGLTSQLVLLLKIPYIYINNYIQNHYLERVRCVINLLYR